MKYRIASILLATLISSPGQSIAEESIYGVGVSVHDGLSIYLPITMDELIIEPRLFITNTDNKSSSTSSQRNDDFRNISIGVGAFKNKKVSKNTYLYYGSRLGYINRKNTFTSSNATPSSSFSSSTKSDGYFIAPTFGAQYYLIPNISVGLDLALMYSKTDGTTTSTSTFAGSTTSNSDTESTAYNTEAEIILRYHF